MVTPPNTAEPASPWVVTQDFVKNVVTVAVALIGLTVTFSSQLLGKTDPVTALFLYATWAIGLITILFGVLAHGLIIGFLKTGSRENLAVAFSNLSFWALFAAALCLAAFGYLAVSRAGPKITAVVATETAVANAPNLTGDKNSKWVMKSLDYDAIRSTFDIVATKEHSTEQIGITVDASGQIISVKRP